MYSKIGINLLKKHVIMNPGGFRSNTDEVNRNGWLVYFVSS